MNVRITSLPTTLLQLGAGALGLAAVGVLLVQGSEAAFTASTKNESNSVTAGTVVLGDSDGGTAMFNVANLNGGQTITRCINVRYDGSLAADIKLHSDITADTGLAAGLGTKVEIGTGAVPTGTFDCPADFVAAAAPTYTGTLAGFDGAHPNYPQGLGGFEDATKGTAENPTSKTYKITMTVPNDNNYQGKSATAAFTWEAAGEDVPTGNKAG